MATRFYMAGSGTPSISPAFDAGWEQTGQAVRLSAVPKIKLSALSAPTNLTVTVPITTTQDILVAQFVSGPLPTQTISGLFSVVVLCDALTSASVNGHLAYVLKIVSPDGGTIRGTLASDFGSGTAFSSSGVTNASTRIYGDGSTAVVLSPQTAQTGDVLVLELGVHAAAPSNASGSAILRFGFDGSADYALTTGLSTTITPWFELSQNLFTPLFNNYQFVKAPDGISVTEKLR